MHMAHSLTANQIQFIIRHELGHLTLDHARKLNSLTDNNDAKILLQREFEFAADAFAFNSFRSTLYSKLRATFQQNVESNDALNSEGKCRNIIEEHQGEGTAIRLLFIYMNAVDEIGLLLKERLGNNINFRNQMDIHPSPIERMQHLDMLSIGEYSPTSKLIRYAEQLFLDTVAHAKNLNTDALTEPLRDRVFA